MLPPHVLLFKSARFAIFVKHHQLSFHRALLQPTGCLLGQLTPLRRDGSENPARHWRHRSLGATHEATPAVDFTLRAASQEPEARSSSPRPASIATVPAEDAEVGIVDCFA